MLKYRKLLNGGVCGHEHRSFYAAAKCGGYEPEFVQVSRDRFKTWCWYGDRKKYGL